MWKCEKCGDYKFDDSKTCNCKKYSVIDEVGDEHNEYALSEEDAAEKFAKWTNESGDYLLMNGTIDILVNGNTYRVGAEPDINYTVEKL